LTKQLRRSMRFFCFRAESQIYEEAKSLVARGRARDRRSYTGERARASYAITAAGRKELTTWLSTPKPTALECEPLLRAFLSDFATADQLRAALGQGRADGQAILEVGQVVGAEYLAGTAPFQGQLAVRAIVFDFLSHHARMLIDWADRTQATLDADPDPTTDARRQAPEHYRRQPERLPASIPQLIYRRAHSPPGDPRFAATQSPNRHADA
jgi:DNA-binding PadR family transcriptional regulator